MFPAFARHAGLSHRKRKQAFADLGRHLLHYVIAVQRPDWRLDVDDDQEKAVHTRKRMLGMAALDRVPVASYHMQFPGIGSIEKSADAHRWVPASYQLDL